MKTRELLVQKIIIDETRELLVQHSRGAETALRNKSEDQILTAGTEKYAL